jgi:ABC-2 type transport system ATP-binding protein
MLHKCLANVLVIESSQFMEVYMDSLAIRTQALTKSYGIVQALRGVDLEVRRGEIFGFLGPNGAGKTTTIRCLLDLIRPDGGTSQVLGIDPLRDPVAVRARVGYLPGELRMQENLTGESALRYLNGLRGGKADWSYIRQLAERMDINLKTAIKNLSRGNKQKVGIIQAIMHRPELLMLDEPTFGLDPLMQREVLHLVAEARQEGATIFFSSHILSEVQEISDRVGIIRLGKVVEVAETEALIARAVRHTRIRFAQPVDINTLESIPGVEVLSHDDGTVVVLKVEGEMDTLIKTVAQFPVVDFETQRASLEEIFLEYYRQ